MERIDCILSNEAFRNHMLKNMESERNRVFCRHDMRHLLDVCRVAWILCPERGIGLPRESVYAAGLLHDIGRWQEYGSGRDHAEAGAELADAILESCGFKCSERQEITNAIRKHRSGSSDSPLGEILYTADKISRPCFDCEVIGQCKRFGKEHKPTLYY